MFYEFQNILLIKVSDEKKNETEILNLFAKLSYL